MSLILGFNLFWNKRIIVIAEECISKGRKYKNLQRRRKLNFNFTKYSEGLDNRGKNL